MPSGQALMIYLDDWASFSIPKYFFSLQIFLQGIFRKKEPAGIFRKKEPMGIFFYCKKTQKTLKDASLIKNMT